MENCPSIINDSQWYFFSVIKLKKWIILHRKFYSFYNNSLDFLYCLSVCKCITGCLVRDFRGIRAEYYKLLPMLCNHDTNENEPHLARDCLFTLGYMAQSILPMGVIPACLEAITQVSKSGSWKARASVLELLQVKYLRSLLDSEP